MVLHKSASGDHEGTWFLFLSCAINFFNNKKFKETRIPFRFRKTTLASLESNASLLLAAGILTRMPLQRRVLARAVNEVAG